MGAFKDFYAETLNAGAQLIDSNEFKAVYQEKMNTLRQLATCWTKQIGWYRHTYKPDIDQFRADQQRRFAEVERNNRIIDEKRARVQQKLARFRRIREGQA